MRSPAIKARFSMLGRWGRSGLLSRLGLLGLLGPRRRGNPLWLPDDGPLTPAPSPFVLSVAPEGRSRSTLWEARELRGWIPAPYQVRGDVLAQE